MQPAPEEALVEAENYVSARDRAHARMPTPNGGDSFIENMEQARRHYENLVHMLGQKEAERLLRKTEAQKPRIGHESQQHTQTPHKRRGSRSR